MNNTLGFITVIIFLATELFLISKMPIAFTVWNTLITLSLPIMFPPNRERNYFSYSTDCNEPLPPLHGNSCTSFLKLPFSLHAKQQKFHPIMEYRKSVLRYVYQISS